jgi:hypothetical protein
MTTPLGQGVAEIRRENGVLVLTDAEGRRQEAVDADVLVRKAWVRRSRWPVWCTGSRPCLGRVRRMSPIWMPTGG